MKKFKLIFSIIAIIISSTKCDDDEDIYPLRRESFITKLDHFSPQDGQTGKFVSFKNKIIFLPNQNSLTFPSTELHR